MTEPFRVLVAEDEAYNRRRLVRLLQEAGCTVVAELGDGLEVLAWLEAGGQADVAFLDVEMPGASGLELAIDLGRRLPIIFVTAHAQYAVKAFETSALDYLLKPVTPERLATALARLQDRRQSPARPQGVLRYPVRAGDGLVFVDLQRTSHFEVEDEVVWAHVGGERQRTPWRSLSECEAAFPPGTLVKGSRNLLLRPEAVVGLRPGDYGRLRVRMQGGATLEVSRHAAPGLKARLGLV